MGATTDEETVQTLQAIVEPGFFAAASITLGEMLPSLAGVQEAGTSVVCAFWSEGLRRLGDLGEVLRNACPIW